MSSLRLSTHKKGTPVAAGIGDTQCRTSLLCAYKRRLAPVNMPNGLCAFDIDDTVTCGIENASRMIKWCKDHDMPVAIVTARPRPIPPQHWNTLGFTADDLLRRFHHNPMSLYQRGDEHGLAKAQSLERLMQQEGVSTGRECVVLFDDMAYNTNAARDAGFTAFQVGNGNVCGITDAQLAHAQGHLHACSRGGISLAES